MTVSSEVSRVEYAGDGSTVTFPVPFYFLANSDLAVVLTDAEGNETTPSVTISGAGNPSGGSVTLAAAIPGKTLTIYRDPPFTQLASLETGGRLPARTLENAADRGVMLAQRLRQLIDDQEGRIVTAAEVEAAVEAAEGFRDEAETFRDQTAAEAAGVDGAVALAVAAADTASAVGGSAVPNYATRAIAAATNIPSARTYVLLAGLAAVGDGGGGLYVKVGAQPTHTAKFQSADGAWWELVAENNEVRIEQFGGQGSLTTFNPSFDNWQAFEDAKAYIVAKKSVMGGGLTLRYGIGTYYHSAALEIKGAIFHIKGNGVGRPDGNGSVLRFPANCDGIIGQRYNTTGRDIHAWSANATWVLGQKVYTSTNVYEALTAGTGGPTGPIGTGASIVDGTVTWKWLRATRPAEVVNAGADGAIIDGVMLWSRWNEATDPRTNHSGILMRCRMRVLNCYSAIFPGHGIAVVANGARDFPGVTGNVNNWYVGHCSMYYNGMDGLYISYSDANAGLAEYCDASQNGRWGIYDASFLGNTHIGHHTAYNGIYGSKPLKRYPSAVIHNGYYYQARLEEFGSSISPNYANEPGTDPYSWILMGFDGTGVPNTNYPAWSASQTYEPGGAFASDNLNARNMWLGCYSEGGGPPSQFSTGDFVAGGLHAAGIDPTSSATIIADNSFHGQFSIRTSINRMGYPPKEFFVRVGAKSNPNSGGDRTVLSWVDPEATFILSGTSGATATNIDYKLQASSTDIFVILGPNTSNTFGRSSPMALGFVTDKLLIGQTNNAARRITSRNAAPTTGDWARGDIVFNLSPSAGGPPGWMCVAAGTPGTWKAMANLAA